MKILYLIMGMVLVLAISATAYYPGYYDSRYDQTRSVHEVFEITEDYTRTQDVRRTQNHNTYDPRRNIDLRESFEDIYTNNDHYRNTRRFERRVDFTDQRNNQYGDSRYNQGGGYYFDPYFGGIWHGDFNVRNYDRRYDVRRGMSAFDYVFNVDYPTYSGSRWEQEQLYGPVRFDRRGQRYGHRDDGQRIYY
jgi:hypothetical protein